MFSRLAAMGVTAEDDADARVRKSVATMTAIIVCVVVAPWTTFYYAIDIPRAAAIPTFYVIASIIGLIHLRRTRDDRFLRYSQIAMFLVLPPLVHVALGGFANSSAVIIFSSVVPAGAISFSGVKRPSLWFAAFAGIVAIMVPLDPWLRERAPYVPPWVVTTFFAVNLVSASLITFLALVAYVRSRDRLAGDLRVERERSDALLRNVLPSPIADRLKVGEHPIADRHQLVGVLFADLVDFTPLSETLDADQLVGYLNELFGAFDGLATRLGVEKVKTIGDAYMAITGAPEPHFDLPSLADLALGMREIASQHAIGSRPGTTIRIGIDVGPVVAGVIGESRFLYDVYGDAVNTASRMETFGVPGRIQVTARAASLLAGAFRMSDPITIDVKGKGPVSTRFLEGRVVDPAAMGT
jgi:adenylate cyclase